MQWHLVYSQSGKKLMHFVKIFTIWGTKVHLSILPKSKKTLLFPFFKNLGACRFFYDSQMQQVETPRKAKEVLNFIRHNARCLYCLTTCTSAFSQSRPGPQNQDQHINFSIDSHLKSRCMQIYLSHSNSH